MSAAQPDEQVVITVTMEPEVAWQLAQFCKRLSFNDFYDLTEAHLTRDERNTRAYQMRAGVDAVTHGLSEAGYSPR